MKIPMARPSKAAVNENAEILTYALLHLEKERDAILAKIASIQQQLGKAPARAAVTPAAPAAPKKKRGRPAKNAAAVAAAAPAAAKERKPRELSPAARKRISMAQKKRWAAARSAKGE